ncbi:hypothetical protein BKM20_27490 [Pseudomonas avellanae]|uniref:Uncharacterized protein n=1 Tax=Pseudomonas avellanae pv. morsprunorum TaxID=3380385 RepID=A0ABX4YQ62_9PSED|nr:Phage integrase [Pseudomonas amygdali pv. morsprunorum str. M302280]KWS59771.1 hypothetical protein AL055_03010 [Pseudomonas amygdali pv. morsprunorum]PHN34800.1 hypothetical protein AO261_16775 [Pseudomonas avellanae]POC82223.1 hypothetical protein BKM26_27285 [Pseudomonas avellanae]POC99570.1 hypothetical protein BKM20_27490 [Pseudomonas avellanae]
MVAAYAKKAGIEVDFLGGMDSGQPQPPMPTEHEADIAEVQAWLGHAKISTTQIYDRRENRPEDSPTFKVKYQRRIGCMLNANAWQMTAASECPVRRDAVRLSARVQRCPDILWQIYLVPRSIMETSSKSFLGATFTCDTGFE